MDNENMETTTPETVETQETQPDENNELDSDLDNDLNDETADNSAELETLKEKNKQLFARVKRAEELVKKNQARVKNNSGEEDSDLRKTVNKLELAERKRQFQYKHNLTPEETDYIYRFAGKEDLDKMLEHPFVKAGLEAIRAQKRVEEAIPSSSSSSRTIEGKSWSELSTDERKKNFDKYVSSFKK